MTTTWDVVVIGGGAAGLIAARDLVSSGLQVMLLEVTVRKQQTNLHQARDRLGGRTWTQSMPGTSVRVDMGAEWFHPEIHSNVKKEAHRYGVAFVEAHMKSQWLFCDGSVRCDDVPAEVQPEFERVMGIIRDQLKLIDFDSGFKQDKCQQLDIPFSEFIRQLSTAPFVQDFLSAQGFTLLGADPAEYSALAVLRDIAGFAAHDENADADCPFDVPLQRLESGAGGLAELIGADFLATHGQLLLGRSVSRVVVSGEQVTVHDSTGDVHIAKTAVVAVPISCLSSIEFEPPLPAALSEAARVCNVGRCAKSWALATGVASEPDDVICFPGVIESYVRHRGVDADEGTAVLAAFSLQDTVPTDAALEAQLRRHHPQLRLQRALTFDFSRDPWSKGTWLALRAGTAALHVEACAAARHPWPGAECPVVFAGGDLSSRWSGWVDGAIESGSDAAVSVLQRLKQR